MAQPLSGIDWDDATFAAALRRAEEGIIEANGVRLTADQLGRLLDAIPIDPERFGRRRLRVATFRGATFSGDADFSRVLFDEDADFGEATFSELALFVGARFGMQADFGEAIFGGLAMFTGAIFDQRADFHRITCIENASFNGAKFVWEGQFRGAAFRGNADFGAAFFQEEAELQEATIDGDASFQMATFVGPASFLNTTFRRGAKFTESTFGGNAGFDQATFGMGANFALTTFSGSSSFSHALFSDRVNFRLATFDAPTIFSNASFRETALFELTTFSGLADFDKIAVGGDAEFVTVTFGDTAGFDRATIVGNARFDETTFGGDLNFHEVAIGGDAGFSEATFERARQLGPLFVSGNVRLDRAVFAQSLRIELSSRSMSCARAVFRGGADIFIRWATISLEDVDFAGPSLVVDLPPPQPANAARAFLGWEEPADGGAWCCRLDAPPDGFTPRVSSLRRAKVARLTVSSADLQSCRFVGAHGLDELRLERVSLAHPPDGWRRVGWRRVRWTQRRTVAEERHWRDHNEHGSGWYESDVQAPHWLADTAEPPDAQQIAGIYRALRKGREDSKDEPGAADFYYGEMEMRRHMTVSDKVGLGGRLNSQFERGLLWLYWAVAGYGLRASRALTALAFTVLVFAVAFYLWGFEDQPFWRALLFSAESTTSLFKAPDRPPLAPVGEALEIPLRLLGPLFFGLALLSLRGRVKR